MEKTIYTAEYAAVLRLLKEFGSSELVRSKSEDQLAAVVGRAAARKIRAHYTAEPVEQAPAL